MAGTSLEGVQHTVEFSKSGDEHVCKVRVIMPDNSEQEFEATCATEHAARLIAVFKASFAVKCARELEESPALQEQEAPAPAERGAEASGDSSPKSLDVESRDIEPQNVPSDMSVDTPLDQYYSSAEEDDDELRVGRGRRSTLHAPIAFVPAPDTPLKPKPVENECHDTPMRNDIDEKSSLERPSLGDAESQLAKDVLDGAPSQERSRETSDVDEGELIEHVAKRVEKGKVDRARFTPQKRKDPPARPQLASGRYEKPQPRKVPSVAQRRATFFRSEPFSDTKRYGTRAGTSRKNGSKRNPSRKGSNLPSSMGIGNNSQEEPVGTNGTTTFRRCERREYDRPRRHKRKRHNAELPATSGYDQDSRIPRGPKKERKRNETDLDLTQSHEYDYTSMYQPQPPPHESMSHAPHPGQYHNGTVPFGGHPMLPGAPPHHMSYPSQYPEPPMPHPPGHMGAPYPPPVPPYATPPSAQAMPSTYMPQPGFPPMMPHAMGAFPYQQPIQNGTNHYYHPHPPAAYREPQLNENQKVNREAEIRATAAQVAAKMAAEAAAKDAVRNAKSDFEADQKAKRAHQPKRTIQGNSKQGIGEGESLAPDPTKNSAKDCHAGSGTAKQGATQKGKSGEKDAGVDSKPADEGDQEDYVSILNRRAQKGITCRNLSTPTYVAVRSENGFRSCQRCTMSVTYVPGGDKEGILITKTVVAGKKKTAKQLAAKEILAEIDKRLESEPQRSDDEDGSKEKAAKAAAQKMSNGITTAVAALHRLYTLNALCGPPCFKPEEPSEGGDRGLWKSVVLLDVKNFGKRSYEAVGPSKKAAKQMCALNAFEALKEMKIPEVESFANITKDGKDPENNKAPEEEKATPIEAIVAASDDDKDSNSSVDAELAQRDDRLMLPKDYKLVLPEDESECEQWFKDNSQSGAHFGLFVDSPRASSVFTTVKTSPKGKPLDVPEEVEHLQPRFLCLSTATSGIVICFPESTEGPIAESADDSNASLPEVVVDTLEDPKTKKHGIAVEDGMSVLEHEEDFRAQAVDDVTIISLAITGLETVERSGPLKSLPELTRFWLRKDAEKISVKGAWTEKSDIPAKLTAKGGKDIIVGVLASYACFCISQQMRQAARQKRTRTHGVAAAFCQLSEQLMSTAPA